MNYLCSENKDADQLRGYREADLRLCFRICKMPVFSRRGSFKSGVPMGSKLPMRVEGFLMILAIYDSHEICTLDERLFMHFFYISLSKSLFLHNIMHKL